MTLSNEERAARLLSPTEKALGSRNNKRHCDLMKNYGISLKEFHERLKAQGGKCPICGREISDDVGYNKANKAMVDHCHKTKKVRGIICRNCNFGIGHLGENIDTLIGAVIYMQAFEERQRRQS